MTEFLLARSLWWDGRMRTGEALRSAGAQAVGVGRRPAPDRLPAPDRPPASDQPPASGASSPASGASSPSSAEHSVATPVPVTEIPPLAPRRHFPGTLLPGILDAHVHSGLVDLAVLRAGGVGSVWDLGSVPDRVAALARRPELPHIRYAGPFLTAPGGYPSNRSWAAPGSWRTISSTAEARDAVTLVAETRATLVKVTAHSGGPRMTPTTLAALVDAAHDAGLPVVVHAEGPGTVAEAYESGADILAHTPWTEPLDPALIKACAERMTWISTLDVHGWGVPTREQATAIGNLGRFLEYGGSVRYGTDLGNGPLPLAVNPREIRALQSVGLTPDEILGTMTGEGVTWIPGGLDLEPARFADVMATARVLDDSVRPRLAEEETA